MSEQPYQTTKTAFRKDSAKEKKFMYLILIRYNTKNQNDRIQHQILKSYGIDYENKNTKLYHIQNFRSTEKDRWISKQMNFTKISGDWCKWDLRPNQKN